MSIKEGLHEYLSGLSGLASLVGSRIYPSEARQSRTRPYVIFWRTQERDIGTLTGASGYRIARLVVECWGRTVLEAEQVAFEVRGDRDHPRLDWSAGTWSVYRVQHVRVEETADALEPPVHGDDVGAHRVMFELVVAFTRAG